MKLLVDLDPELLEAVMKATGAKTKKEAVIIPMRDYLLGKEKEKLIRTFGTESLGLSLADLKRNRRKWR